MGGKAKPAASRAPNPPAGLSLDSATALLNLSMARMMPNRAAPIISAPCHPPAPAPASASLPSPSVLLASPSSHTTASSNSIEGPCLPHQRPWSQQEADLFLSSARRRGNDYEAIVDDLQAAGHLPRTTGAIKTRYHRLRAQGVFGEPAATSQRLASLATQRCTSSPRASSALPSLSRPGSSASQATSNGKKRKVVKPHCWTEEEKRVLLRIGDEYLKPGTVNKLDTIYKQWKKHFPLSKLGAPAVYVYLHSLRKKKRGEHGESDGQEDEEEDEYALSSAPSSPAPAARPSSTITNAPQRAVASPRYAFSKRTTPRKATDASSKKVPNGKTWQPDEVEALAKVHRMLTVKKIKYIGPGQIHEAYCELMPDTERSQASVGKKYLALYAESIRDSNDESSGVSVSGEEEEDGGGEEQQQHGRESSILTALSSRDLSQEAAALSGDRTVPASATILPSDPVTTFEKQDCPPCGRTSFIDQACGAGMQPSAYTAPSSFPSSFPLNPTTQARLPTLDLLATATPTGLLLENCIGLGISIFGPASFKIFNPPQQAADLAQPPFAEQPAFSFVVGEGGALQKVIAPKGTTMSLSLIGGAGKEVQRAEGGVRGRLGVESVLRGADGYTITVRNWL